MRRGPKSRRSEVVFAWVGANERNKILDGCRRHRRMDSKRGRESDSKRDRLEILVRIVRDCFKQTWIDDVVVDRDQNRMAVGRCARCLAGTNIGARARDVLDVELLSEMFR